MNHTTPRNPRRAASIACIAGLGALALAVGCSRPATEEGAAPAKTAEKPAAPTNRVDIPLAVRRNLGITFAKVEPRAVASTLRVPGAFEALPDAHRELRAVLAGTVEFAVRQFERVEAGALLSTLDAPAWRELHEEIAATEAKVASMTPLREAHAVHEAALEEKVRLWEARLVQLEEIRAAGGASATQITEARAELIGTRAELADVMEKDATLEATQRESEAHLRALRERRLATARACGLAADFVPRADGRLEVRASHAGVVEEFGAQPGALVPEGGMLLTLFDPSRVRFRARALQSDIARLKEGLPVQIVPPAGGDATRASPLGAMLRLGLSADPVARSIDLFAEPAPEAIVAAGWAREGVGGSLEILLEGGRAELAIPAAAIVRDGGRPMIFRRDPANPDKVIRMEADLGVSDGRWVAIQSGVKQGDEIVVGGNYQLMLASGGSAPKGGHFHSDGTFHEGED